MQNLTHFIKTTVECQFAHLLINTSSTAHVASEICSIRRLNPFDKQWAHFSNYTTTHWKYFCWKVKRRNTRKNKFANFTLQRLKGCPGSGRKRCPQISVHLTWKSLWPIAVPARDCEFRYPVFGLEDPILASPTPDMGLIPVGGRIGPSPTPPMPVMGRTGSTNWRSSVLMAVSGRTAPVRGRSGTWSSSESGPISSRTSGSGSRKLVRGRLTLEKGRVSSSVNSMF